jgi:hypothetical protein
LHQAKETIVGKTEEAKDRYGSGVDDAKNKGHEMKGNAGT